MVQAVTNVLPEHLLRERRQRLAKSDCRRELPSNALTMSQLNGSLLGVDLNVLSKAKRERAQKDAWEDFTASCKRMMNAAPPDAPDPREQMFLFIKDMQP
jgi:hypothetical protein